MYFLLFLLFSPCFSYIPSDLKYPPDSSFILDPDELISNSSLLEINKNIANVKDVQIGVLIINKISKKYKTSYHDSEDTRAKKFATEIFDFWGVGDREKQNGLLIFISKLDRKFRIVTGKGAMELVSNDASDQIFENVKPKLKDNDFSGAILESISLIDDKLHPNVFTRFINYVGPKLVILLIVSVFVWFIYSSISDRTEKQSFDKNLKKLQQLQREGQLNTNFLSNNCAICLEEIKPSIGPQQEELDDTNVILKCGHNFHKKCLKDWIQKKNECPLCKKKDPMNPDTDLSEDNNLKSEERIANSNNNNNFLSDLLYIQRTRYPSVSGYYSFNNITNDSETPFTFKYTRASSSGGKSFFRGGSSIGGGGGGGSW